MNKKEIQNIIKKINKSKETIAKERDNLRDYIDEINNIADDCEDAINNLEACTDALSRLL